MANNTVYVGDTGTRLIVDIGIPADTVTQANLVVKKPNNTTVTWVASPVLGTQTIDYIIQTNDLDVAGEYSIQAYITTADWTGHGTIDLFFVNPIL